MLEHLGLDTNITTAFDGTRGLIAQTHAFGPMQLLRFEGGGLSLSCNAVAGGPDLLAIILTAGEGRLRADSREITLSRGAVAVVPLTAAVEFSFPTRFSLVGLTLSQGRLPATRQAEPGFGPILIPSTQGAAPLFVSFATAFAQFHEDLSSLENNRSADTLIDLLNAALRPHIGERPRSSRDLHHRERIEKLVARELHNPALDIPFIARNVGLSTRHVHRLFAQDSAPLMRQVLGQRLDSCYQEIAAAANPARAIGEIAYSRGFNNQAHFSRAFRKRFGITPSALRAARHDSAVN
ncbi:MAG: helix-turn-helix domain-containing protein [Burkholderiales bacterium]